LLTIAAGISSNFGALASNIVLVIFVALYWVADRERIERLWLSLLSPSQRTTARKLVYEMEDAIGSYLRSQIVQYVLSLMLLAAGFTLLGLSYPFLLAWVASLVWFVPLMGGFLALIPALMLGLIDGYTGAVMAVVYTILIFVVVRRLVQRFPSLRQRPGSILGLMIAMALIDVMGIIGLVIAMPVTVAIHVLLNHYLNASSPVAAETPELQMQSMMDKLTLIQNRINDEETTIEPSTMSIFARLRQMVAALDGKD
jgi:predicted PurR-regulated permease PerM